MAYKFVKTSDSVYGTNREDEFKILIQISQESTLPEVLLAFKGFLQACGYVVNGELAVVEED